MAFSTIAQLRKNVIQVDTTEMSDADVTLRIAQADKEINQDLANYIDFSLVPAIGDSLATPNYINLLSQYKTAEFVLAALHGGGRKIDEVSDVQYYEKRYSNPNPSVNEREGLLERIMSGSIPLVLSDGTSIAGTSHKFIQDSRKGIKPALGDDEFGEFADEDELKEKRPID